VSYFHCPITQKKGSNLPEIEHFIKKKGMPSPLAKLYKWPKHMGLKRAAIGNSFGEHIGNLMGTHWELEKNIEGTC
jgi:hypothetical protein